MKFSEKIAQIFVQLKSRVLALAKKKYFPHIAICCALALVVGAVAVVQAVVKPILAEPPEEIILPSFTMDIKSLAADGNNCIPTDTAFLLTTSEHTDRKYIEPWLTTSPQFDYRIEETENPLEYKLTPKSNLEQNSLYSLSFDPMQTANDLPEGAAKSFVFQTQREFGVERSHPADKTTGVPVNSAVEITFTRDVSVEALVKNVTFEPAIEGGAWSKTDTNIYSFTSDKYMEAGAVYTVSVSGELADSLGGDKLGQEYVFQFKTLESESDKNEFYLSQDNNAFISSEPPSFQISFQDKLVKSIDVKIFLFKDINDYVKALNNKLDDDPWSRRAREPLDTAALDKVFEYTAEIFESNSWRGAVVMPEALPKGFYAAEFSLNGQTGTTLFQITDLSAYAMGDERDILFWVNNLATALPVPGAEVSVFGDSAIGKTDDEGILTAKKNESSDAYSIFHLQKSGDRLLIALRNRDGDKNEFNPQDYWTYTYPDKPLYAPSDTVNFFGVVSPKLPGTKPIDKVTIVIEEDYWGDEPKSELRTDVDVKNGVFEGKLELPELAPGDYYLSVYYGDTNLSSVWLNVDLYKKPALRFGLSADKSIVWSGEQATITATVEYFDGTRVPGLDIKIDEKNYKTDSLGSAAANVKYESDSRELISRKYVGAEASLPELGNVYESIRIASINSDVEIEADAIQRDDVCNLEIQAFAVDLTDIAEEDMWDTRKYLKDFAGELPLNVNLIKASYQEVPTGEKRYDPYTRTYTVVYRYEKREQLELSKEVIVHGGTPESFELPFTLDEQASHYKIQISGKDRSGRAFTRDTYLYSSQPQDDSRIDNVYIKDNNGVDEGYAVGDSVSLSLYGSVGSGDSVRMDSGTALFVRAADRFIDYSVNKENEFNFVFDGSVVPNINVFSVYFNGREYITNAWCYSAHINRESRALHVDVSADKETYKPGDTARLTFRLTDPEKRAVKGIINVNVVDEALLNMQEETADINYQIFSNYYYYYPEYAISHILTERWPEGGAGNGGWERSDFGDTALFKTVETNRNGTAELEVKLPDNITSWRIFWQAFNPSNVMAGSGKTNIIATLPFFIDIRLGDIFLAGDKPQLGVRSAGTATAEGGTVQYTVDIATLNYSETASAPVSGAWNIIQLPELPAGEHGISVSAEHNGHTDKVASKIRVVDSIATALKNETVTITNDTIIDVPASGMVRAVFTDRQKAQVIHALQNISATGSIRAEQLIAKRLAADALAATGEDVYYGGADYKREISEYQNSDGSVSPFSYGDDPDLSLETTALSCAAQVEGLNKSAMARYLKDVLQATRKNDARKATVALLGLAALKEPVLQDINGFSREDSAPQVKLNLALARTLIGDGVGAENAVREMLSQYCTAAGDAMYMSADGNEREETIKNTADLALAATLLDMPEGDMLFQYVLENEGVEDLYMLQQALALKHKAMKVNPDYATFSYSLDGKETKIRFNTSHSIMLTAEQLRNIRFDGVEREIVASVSYSTAGFPPGNNSLLAVSQNYTDMDTTTQGTALGIISFSISESAPDGRYDIVHILPAGLDYTSLVTGRDIWVSEVKGKQTTFTVYKKKAARSGTIQFNARPIMTGYFRSEGTFITNPAKPEFTNRTEGGAITIK